MPDAQILHRGMAIIINGDHSTSMLSIIQGQFSKDNLDW